MFTVSLSLSHTDTHINILIFMSLCSHCVHMLSLVFCCCSAAHKLAFSQQPSNNTKAVSTPLPPGPPPVNYIPFIHTHIQHNDPAVTKLLLLRPS